MTVDGLFETLHSEVPDGRSGTEKVYVGWREVVGIKYHDEAAHPYVEIILENDDG